MEKEVANLEKGIEEMKRKEIKRLLNDYRNPNSFLRKNDVNIKQIFLCLYGDTSWEAEFYKQLKIIENSKRR